MSTKPVSSSSQPSVPVRVLGRTGLLLPPEVARRCGGLRVATRAAQEILRRWPPTVGHVAITESAQPPTREKLDSMAAELEGGWDAVVACRPVSEAVKIVEAGWVAGSIDRTGLISILPPILIKRKVLAAILSFQSEDSWIDPVESVMAGGGKVRVSSWGASASTGAAC
ncbi:MAG: 2-C-methyl-D-erythritol 4-phosphate cytidylyltransferase [Acidimicrobiia bacterium]|nr:2-C-methyl-D-erythritol 4-phosphate cytidylyltransferase [Acidimicrobiia bacterium]MYK55752.1 2-C-methyl-D-erythritol 4-phosphate cytidylyltransferase [Acidimicrobiia bacterium]